MVGPDPISIMAMGIPAIMRYNLSLGIFVMLLFLLFGFGFFLKKNSNDINELKEDFKNFKDHLDKVQSEAEKDKEKLHERMNAMNKTLSGIEGKLELFIKMKLDSHG